MHIIKITNPNTGRQVTARAWSIQPRTIVDAIKDGRVKDSRDLSWQLLSDDESYAAMRAEQYGDDAGSNFALGIFENALDWRLGGAVYNFINSCIRHRRMLPKPFQVAVTRAGDVFIVGATGKVYTI